MIVKRADFITSMKDYGDFATKGCPEVAFAGKSNVGKSSMINKLTNRNKLARTSATPGKTRLINVYQINNEINFIDLPGPCRMPAPCAPEAKSAQKESTHSQVMPRIARFLAEVN